jgi:hypothetical protein
VVTELNCKLSVKFSLIIVDYQNLEIYILKLSKWFLKNRYFNKFYWLLVLHRIFRMSRFYEIIFMKLFLVLILMFHFDIFMFYLFLVNDVNAKYYVCMYLCTFWESNIWMWDVHLIINHSVGVNNKIWNSLCDSDDRWRHCCKSVFHSFLFSHSFKHGIKAWLLLKEWKFKLYAIIVHSKFFVFVFQYWSIHHHAMYLWCLNHWETFYGDTFYTWKLKLYFVLHQIVLWDITLE